MNVKELIDWLKEFPEDCKVLIVDPDDSEKFCEIDVILGCKDSVKLLG